jgi:hypothetical protein
MGRDRGKYGDDAIERVEVWLDTNNVTGAGTDGEVYLVLGGREFNIKRGGGYNDRQQGATDYYVLGQGANIEHKKENNPTGIPIQLVWDNEFGLRFEPQAGLNPPDAWNLASVGVAIHTIKGYEDWGYLDGALTGPGAPGPDPGTGLWLGWHYGLIAGLELEVQEEDKSPLQRKQEYQAG